MSRGSSAEAPSRSSTQHVLREVRLHLAGHRDRHHRRHRPHDLVPVEDHGAGPGIFLNIALVIHSNEALLAMGVIFIFVHFFSAHLRPESFPIDKVIFTG